MYDFDDEDDELDLERHRSAEDGFQTLDDFLAWADEERERSVAEGVAYLSQEEQDALLDGIDPEAFLYSWNSWARPSQILPPGDWVTGVIMAGRGWGKSRCGSEWIRDKVRENPGCRILLLGRTAADVRDIMVQGDSGILACSAPSEAPEYIAARRTLLWPNGSQALLMSSMEPSLLRGPQAHFSWADEIGAYSHIPDDTGLTAWQNLRIATRLGKHPQVITTTTPKRMPAVVELLDESTNPRSKTILIRGRTIDNLGALPRSYLEMLFNLYHGTALWRQEILGELIDAAEGALWTEELIERTRHRKPIIDINQLPFRVLAVDPSVAENPKDECGIVVVGATGNRKVHKRHAYVLEDATLLGSPAKWVEQVVEVANRWKVAGIVAEGNQGRELVKMAIESVDPNLRVFLVNAKRSKALRAEPVVTAYEAGRVHHVGHLPMLETQMTTWEPELKKRKSPDRIDALVYGVMAAILEPPKGLFSLGSIRARSVGGRRIEGVKKSSYAGHSAPLRAA